MNPTEIADALEAMGQAAFNPAEFGFAFAEATDNPEAAIAKLRNGVWNKSDLPGGVLLNRKFHYVPAEPGQLDAALGTLRANKKTASAKPAILITTDGKNVAAEDTKSGDTLHCAFAELGGHFAFFLPAAGIDRYRAAEENPIDVKATGKLARLYDALLKTNIDWRAPERRHDINLFMTRLIFCLFAEDVGVFPENQFSNAVFSYSGNQGEHARDVLIRAFRAMNRPKGDRPGLPAWTEAFEYVNGGLFSGNIDAPNFDPIAFRYLRDAANLNWKLINPDIFGSMIQSIADVSLRAELGMHYTSVPNIMRVLGPLFLDDLDVSIEKAWSKPAALRAQLDRLAKVRVFDPACGSGNFLVIAYRELRSREIRILKRIGELEGNPQNVMWSRITLGQFYGIELTDFAAETAKLALFIAEYQANATFADVFGRMSPLLPLRDGGHITCANALQVDWEQICPFPTDGGEVYIVGNPPYLGAKKREDWQTDDMVHNGLGNKLILDYVTTWLFKASRYCDGAAPFAFVTTSSICQGEQVAPLWESLLADGARIDFAYRPFEWRNSAARNAGVWVAVVGMSRRALPVVKLYDGNLVSAGKEISPYLILDKFVLVRPIAKGLFGLPEMVMGSNPVDGKHLSVTEEERLRILSRPGAEEFVREFLGGDELLKEKKRYCIWVPDKDLDRALAIPEIAQKIESCRTYRASAGRDARKVAGVPHRFCYSTFQDLPALAVPNSQSSERQFIPATMVRAGVVLSKEAFAVYNPPDYLLSIVSSTLHRLWLATVGGRIGNGFRYSVKVVYNTFPVPALTEEQKAQLSDSARKILRVRYANFRDNLFTMYDPSEMPEELRAAHKENDDLLEGMYIGRPFRNDTERLEKLFRLYAARVGR